MRVAGFLPEIRVETQPSAVRTRPKLCNLDSKSGLLTSFRASKRSARSSPSSAAFRVTAVVCLLLIALVAVAQVVHVHANQNDALRCPLCITMHSAAPASMASAAVVLVQLGISVLVFKVRAIARYWHPKLFTRPPPAAC